MAQAAAKAIDPSMLRRLEVRCADIKELAFKLDRKCWKLERKIERLGMESCNRDYEMSELSYIFVKEWVDEVERGSKESKAMNQIDKRIEERLKLRRDNVNVLLAYFNTMTQDAQLDLLSIVEVFSKRHAYQMALVKPEEANRLSYVR